MFRTPDVLGMFVLVVAAACGRIGFDDFTAGDAPVLPAGRWAQVAPTHESTCAVTLAGELWCWGSGRSGVLGIGTTPEVAPPTRVGTDATWTSVSLEGSHACGLRSDGALLCWGTNAPSAVGTGPAPVRIGTDAWTAVDVGRGVTCAIRADATLWCWGENADGQLGDGTTTDRPDPQQVGTATWQAISVGERTTCGIQPDRSLWCWGWNGNGQVGDGTSGMAANRSTPVQIGSGRAWRVVSVGVTHACAVDDGGAAWCWGAGYAGKLGTGNGDESAVPVPSLAPGLVMIAVGTDHTCGATATEELWCWGRSNRGAIPGITTATMATPVRIPSAQASQVAAAGSITCVLDREGHLACSGDNAYGQVAQPPGEALVPERTDAYTDWTELFAHVQRVCGRTSGGALRCWGQGTTGDNTELDRQVPMDITGDYTVIALGPISTHGIRADQTFWSWGYEYETDAFYPAPRQIASGKQSTALGNAHACAVTVAGALECRGRNNHGQLGDGTFIDANGVSVPGTWRRVVAGKDATCATRSDGGLMDRLFCWGDQTRIASATITDLASPTAAELPLLEVRQTTLGDDFGCAIIGTGELWCWGDNSDGQLGTGSFTSSQTPVRVGARADWVDVDAGEWHVCAIAADRTLWCWGHADQGQAGAPIAGGRPTPYPIDGATDWVDVACGDRFTCALKQDGTRWCFGANPRGELGNGRSWLTDLAIVP